MDGESVRHETYVAYLLRLWQAGTQGGQPVWRASLEDSRSGERMAFGDIHALSEFLAEVTSTLTAGEQSPDAR